MKRKSKRRRAAFIATSVVLAGGAAVLGAYGVEAAQQSDHYTTARQTLNAAIDQALTFGYTPKQLSPVTSEAQQLEAGTAPLWIGDRVTFYEQRAGRLEGLRTNLAALEQAALTSDRQASEKGLSDAKTKLSDAQAVGVDPVDLAPLQTQFQSVTAAEAAARQPKDYVAVTHQVQQLIDKASSLAQAQEAQVAAIEASAQQLVSQDHGNAGQIRSAGLAALVAGRNDATVAAYLKMTSTDRPYRSLEHYGGLLQSPDLNQLAMGAAGAIHYQQLIHQDMLSGLPAKVIVVSHQGQELWAYQGGKQVLDSLVTTGRPQLPTDIGAMRVLSKNSPWTMVSPWPKSSPWYYPPTVVQMVLWFTNTGEGLHDAYWEWSSQYGPGSEYGPAASHGCIHLPYKNEAFLFNWAPVGTPVIVYPGDGSPVSNQVAQISVDANGQPVTGPKGA